MPHHPFIEGEAFKQMADGSRPLRTFMGSEIGPAIIAAVEAVRRDQKIVTFKAGENMPITAGLATEDNDGFIPEYSWTGEVWIETGYL